MAIGGKSQIERRPRSKQSGSSGNKKKINDFFSPATSNEGDDVVTGYILCPMCQRDLGKFMRIEERVLHVESCLEADEDEVSITCTNEVTSTVSAVTCNTSQVVTNEVPAVKKPSLPKSSSAPFYKILQIGNQKIAVDAFSYGPIPGVSTFFLTHFHSDHYGGLTKSWRYGIIYCTPATSRLIQKYLNVDPKIIREIELDEWCVINGVEILFLSANHCPGSAIILFSAPDFTILHTGDFRASESQVTRLTNIMKTRPIDVIYLDTTYLDPSHSFPSQETVIATCGDYCYNFKHYGENKKSTIPTLDKFFKPVIGGRTSGNGVYNPLVIVGTYTIGKERLAMHIAERLNTKIFTQDRKKDTLMTIGDSNLDSLLGTNGFECGVHLVNMRQLNWDSLEEYFKPLTSTFTHLLAFMPTGWTYKPSKNNNISDSPPTFNLKDLEKCRKIKNNIQLFKVPYSEHSSFLELEQFCTGLNVRKIIPTVNVQNANSRGKMNYYLEQWVKS